MTTNSVRAFVAVSIASLYCGCSPSTQTEQNMQTRNGLESEVRGAGEAILLIHGAYLEDALLPLANERALGKYRVIRYNRRGYGNSARHLQPLSIAGEAQDARGLLESLGIERAHVVGYSSGGLIALELALSAPQVVGSLTLIEPPFNVEVAGSFPIADFLSAALALYNTGDKGARRTSFWEAFSDLVGERNCRGSLRAEWSRSSGTQTCSSDPRCTPFWPTGSHPLKPEFHSPFLLILSNEGVSQAAYAQDLMTWLPQTQRFVVADANHNLPMKQPRSIAQRLAAF